MNVPIDMRRAATSDDETCGDMVFQAFAALAERHGFPPNFPSPDAAIGMLRILLARENVVGFLAERERRPIGCVFIDLAAPVAGVALIAVATAAQAGGVGRRRMWVALDLVENAEIAGLRLVQAAYNNASLSLYTTLGFQARQPLSVLQGTPPRLTIERHRVRPAEGHDVPVCAELCRSLIGFERTGDLLAAVAARTAMVVEAGQRVVGYTTGIGFLGHTVAEGDEGLKALISAAPTVAGPGFLLPTANQPVLSWCFDHGLRLVMPMTYMSLGPYAEPAGGWLPSIVR